jgi:hypothetical protein
LDLPIWRESITKPYILERYVFGDLAGRDANGARTTEVAAEASEIGGV